MDLVTTPRPLPARYRRAERTAAAASFVRSIDWILVGAVAALVAYGLWAIGGITRHDIVGNEGYYLVRQGVYAAMGALALVAGMLVSPQRLREGRRIVLALLVGLLLLVLLAAEFTRGSKRWIDVGFFQFQPSEFGKVLFVLVLAALVADAGPAISEWKTVLRILGVALVPTRNRHDRGRKRVAGALRHVPKRYFGSYRLATAARLRRPAKIFRNWLLDVASGLQPDPMWIPRRFRQDPVAVDR